MLVNVQYPDVVLNVKDVKASIDAGDKISDMLEKHLTELDSNITILDSEESGIERREKILGIKPLDTASLEDRRLEVLIRWYDTPLYTEVTLRQKLDSVLGQGNYVLTIDLDAKQVKCQIELTRQMMFKSVQELFEQMVPLDYLIDVTLRYNQHITLAKYTHAQLAERTHFALRNEALDADANAREKFSTRMGETQNYSLKKPAPEDFYNVEDFNENFDIIDQKMKEIETAASGGITYENAEIPVSGWKASGEYWIYQKTFAGAASINVYFNKNSLPIAIQAGILPVTETIESVCTLYATNVPESDLTATFEIVKGE